jgi:hypothetical protein
MKNENKKLYASHRFWKLNLGHIFLSDLNYSVLKLKFKKQTLLGLKRFNKDKENDIIQLTKK